MHQNILPVFSAAAALLLLTLFAASAMAAAPAAGGIAVSGMAGASATIDPAEARRRELRNARQQLRQRLAPGLTVLP